MSNGSDRRLRLFARGAEAARRIDANLHQETYFCPICETDFSRADAEEGELTLEHVPPDALGGDPILLTCRACNSFAGHELDAEAANRQQIIEFAEGLSGRRPIVDQMARLNLAGEVVNILLNSDPQANRIELAVLGEVNDPAAVQRQLENLEAAAREDTWDGTTFQITPNIRWHDRRADLSNLRTAYLMGFALFGYRYAFHERLDPVRQQIRNPDETIIRVFCLPNREEIPDAPRALLTEGPFEAFVVQLRREMVLLPWVDGPADLYENLPHLLAAAGDQGRFQGQPLITPTELHMTLDLR